MVVFSRLFHRFWRQLRERDRVWLQHDIPVRSAQLQRAVQYDDNTCNKRMFHYIKASETLQPRQHSSCSTYRGKLPPFACFRCLEGRACQVSDSLTRAGSSSCQLPDTLTTWPVVHQEKAVTRSTVHKLFFMLS